MTDTQRGRSTLSIDEPCRGVVDGWIYVFAACTTCGTWRTRATKWGGWRWFRRHAAAMGSPALVSDEPHPFVTLSAKRILCCVLIGAVVGLSVGYLIGLLVLGWLR